MAKMTKEQRILALLRERSLNRFQAQEHGDWVLPSTVAALRRKGYIFLAQWEEVPTRYGTTARVKRYDLIGHL
jgi:hypothetical protein